MCLACVSVCVGVPEWGCMSLRAHPVCVCAGVCACAIVGVCACGRGLRSRGGLRASVGECAKSCER